jgi:hypothetical protein
MVRNLFLQVNTVKYSYVILVNGKQNLEYPKSNTVSYVFVRTTNRKASKIVREFNEVKKSIVYSDGPLLLLYKSEYFQPVNKRQTAGHQMALKLGNW